MPKFICIKNFWALQTNGNGNIVGNCAHMITRGTLLEKVSNESYQFAGTPFTIKLRNSVFCIEISKEQFMNYFEKAEDLP